jgi:acyl-CoA dehydrogenase
MPGFTRGRELEKMGCKVQDTAELSFVDVRLPAANVLGEEGEAFGYLGHNLPQERLTVAVGSVSQARSAIAAAIGYTKNRKAFGTPVASFQNTNIELAACSTEVEAAQAMLDRAVALHVEGELSAADAARVNCRRPMPPGSSCSAPKCSSGSWTGVCSCSAATAT